MGDLLSLHRGHRKAGILKNAEEAHDGRNHGEQSEVLRHEQSGEHHDVGKIQKELRALRHCGDQPAGDRALSEIRQQMIGRKVLFGGAGCRRSCRWKGGAACVAFHRVGKINTHHLSRFVEWERSGGFAKPIGLA